MRKWAETAGGGERGARYAARFEQLAAQGQDVHGEADFCAALAPPGSRVLDAGCGTGRVAIRLAELGYRCVGVDVDAAMLAQARATAPALEWVEADLAADIPGGSRFDLVVAAGNVLPFLDRGTEAAAIGNLATVLVEDGVLVTGFGLDSAHLPLAAAPFGLDDFDTWCHDTGLTLVDRYATWSRDPYRGGGYAVSVHRR